MARNYKNIQVYHLAYQFVLHVYQKSNFFPKEEIHNITSQLGRASVSIPLNIAEGSAKASDREFAYFLNVSYASAKEVEVLVNLCFDLGYLNKENYQLLSYKSDELNAKLYLFLRNVESRVKSPKRQFFQKFEEKVR
ncbi:four helix bundle protein [Candidatus Woesearchaeota archaeon]|nr:four helix bundle protein [Candidatus Woesearchaeota archaeon]